MGIAVNLVVADRAGLPSAGKAADKIHATGPPAVLVSDDGGGQVKPVLPPVGGQDESPVLMPAKACQSALGFKGRPRP